MLVFFFYYLSVETSHHRRSEETKNERFVFFLFFHFFSFFFIKWAKINGSWTVIIDPHSTIVLVVSIRKYPITIDVRLESTCRKALKCILPCSAKQLIISWKKKEKRMRKKGLETEEHPQELNTKQEISNDHITIEKEENETELRSWDEYLWREMHFFASSMLFLIFFYFVSFIQCQNNGLPMPIDRCHECPNEMSFSMKCSTRTIQPEKRYSLKVSSTVRVCVVFFFLYQSMQVA